MCWRNESHIEVRPMRIVIGYDGSEGARAAIDDLQRAGLPNDVHARVVSVADVFPHLTSEFFEDGKSPVIETSHLVREAKALARHALSVTPICARGNPRKIL